MSGKYSIAERGGWGCSTSIVAFPFIFIWVMRSVRWRELTARSHRLSVVYVMTAQLVSTSGRRLGGLEFRQLAPLWGCLRQRRVCRSSRSLEACLSAKCHLSAFRPSSSYPPPPARLLYPLCRQTRPHPPRRRSESCSVVPPGASVPEPDQPCLARRSHIPVREGHCCWAISGCRRQPGSARARLRGISRGLPW